MNTQISTFRGVPSELHEHFRELGYSLLNEHFPDFGGIIIFLQGKKGERETAYYISKPSPIEFVTSDELRRALDFLKEHGIRLQHVVSTSPLSDASLKLTAKLGIRRLQYRYVENAKPTVDDARVKRLRFHLRLNLTHNAGRTK